MVKAGFLMMWLSRYYEDAQAHLSFPLCPAFYKNLRNYSDIVVFIVISRMHGPISISVSFGCSFLFLKTRRYLTKTVTRKSIGDCHNQKPQPTHETKRKRRKKERNAYKVNKDSKSPWIKIKEVSSFKSNENIHMKENGSYYVVSANKVSSVTPWNLF